MYTDLVAEAERAVSAVNDPELKRAAFEKVLDDLLASSGDEVADVQMRGTGKSDTRRRSKKAKSLPRASRAKHGGPQTYVEELVGDGFFSKPKTISAVKAELSNRGRHIPLTSLSGPLQKLCQKKLLRRQKAGEKGSKKAFAYSNW